MWRRQFVWMFRRSEHRAPCFLLRKFLLHKPLLPNVRERFPKDNGWTKGNYVPKIIIFIAGLSALCWTVYFIVFYDMQRNILCDFWWGYYQSSCLILKLFCICFCISSFPKICIIALRNNDSCTVWMGPNYPYCDNTQTYFYKNNVCREQNN